MREAESLVKQHLKKARVNIIHKLSRQAAKFGKKRGSTEQLQKQARKLQRLRQQIEEAKEVDLEDLAKDAVAAGPCPDRVETIKTTLSLPFGPERLRQELILSAPVQNALTVLQKRRDRLDGKTSDKPARKEKERKKPEEKKVMPAAADNKAKPGPAQKPFQAAEELSDSDAGIGPSGVVGDSGTESDETLACVGFGVDPASTAKTRKDGKRKPSRKIDKSRETFGEAPANRKESSRRPKGAEKRHKNRLGQRARQKVWEEKFGTAALHVVENRPANQPRVFKKKKKKEGEDCKGGDKHGARGTPAAGTKRGAAPPPAEDLSTLHPSWAAKRMNKEKCAGIQSFEGKRMTFNDSD